MKITEESAQHLATRLAVEFIHVRGAHNPTAEEMDDGLIEVRPCAWCRLAGQQALEALSRLIAAL